MAIDQRPRGQAAAPLPGSSGHPGSAGGKALLARAHSDQTGYRDYRDRYRAMATSLGFEGHMKWAEAMAMTGVLHPYWLGRCKAGQPVVWTISTSVLALRETLPGIEPNTRPRMVLSPTLPTTSRSAVTSSVRSTSASTGAP